MWAVNLFKIKNKSVNYSKNNRGIGADLSSGMKITNGFGASKFNKK